MFNNEHWKDAAKTDTLGSMSRTQMVQGLKQLLKVVFPPMGCMCNPINKEISAEERRAALYWKGSLKHGMIVELNFYKYFKTD